MGAKSRREEVLNVLLKRAKSISASTLAEMFSVSRQVIVGDIALLRAEENKIIATSTGYILEDKLSDLGYTGKIVCSHPPDKTREELYTIVDLGGKIINVEIDHEVYGEITGKLGIASRAEVDSFIDKVASTNAKLLTELTNGVHIHTVSAKDKSTFDKIKNQLHNMGFIYIEEN